MCSSKNLHFKILGFLGKKFCYLLAPCFSLSYPHLLNAFTWSPHVQALHPLSPRWPSYQCSSVGVARIGWRFILPGKMIPSEGKSEDRAECKQRGVTRGAGFDDAWRNKC